MPIENKKPPIRIRVIKEDFNKVIELLSITSTLDDKEIKEKSIKCKDKLLTYSFILDDDLLELRFFPYEAELLMQILMCQINGIEPQEDYFKILQEKRFKYKENIEKERE